ncbi:MAG: hypothetical protein MZV49_17045 [Rhodopseudomonas palustris]|nr:hypothetical protein [Rhodopseudomonas palustris]
MTESTNHLTITDAAIPNATLPPGKAQHYLHDDKLPGLALRMRATGGELGFTSSQAGGEGTQRKTLGAWPKYNEGGPQGGHHRRRRGHQGGWTRTTRSARQGGNWKPRSSSPR